MLISVLAAVSSGLPILAEAPPLAPILILVLCVVAGVGTVLALPSVREVSIRRIGGVLLLAAALILAALLVRHTAGSPDAARGGMGVYFWIFSAIALIGSMRVITHPRPVYSALYFVLTVMASAGLFVLLWAQFMAAALVLIYAGAILVTYVFVIMLAAQAGSALAEYDRTSREPLAACTVGFALMGVLLLVIFDRAQAVMPRPDGPSAATIRAALQLAPDVPAFAPGSTQALAAYLFSHQLVNLELAGVILTVAMVGAIVIARRRVVSPEAEAFEAVAVETAGGIEAPGTSDSPHDIPIAGTDNPRQKEYPER